MGSILTAMFGTTIFSAGVILQKKGSDWMGWSGKHNRIFLNKLLIWFIGIFLSYVLSALFIAAASKELPPEMVSAITGLNIVIIVILSYFFLKEKLYMTDIIYSVIIVSCILLMSNFSSIKTNIAINFHCIYWLLLLPFVLIIPVLFRFTDNKKKTVLLSVFSGVLAGLTIVFMNILIKECGGTLQGIISSPLLYIYFITGFISVAAKQIAYRLGDVILITPLQTSFTMIYPPACSFFLFNSQVSTAQFLMIIMIVVSCWRIQKKR